MHSVERGTPGQPALKNQANASSPGRHATDTFVRYRTIPSAAIPGSGFQAKDLAVVSDANGSACRLH